MTRPTHIPVLLPEVIEGLALRPGLVVLDGTVGLGGHAERVLERIGASGRLLAIDRDARQLSLARERLRRWKNVVYAPASYKDATQIAYEHGIRFVDAALLDVGFASTHVDDPARGFSFQTEGPLDMRYDLDGPLTAGEVVNTWPEEDLAVIFARYGEERQSARLAKAIVERRKKQPFATTTDLAEYIALQTKRSGKIHPATRIFQALRIAVNDELGELAGGLTNVWELLAPGGRLAVISFHSLEDRLVKKFFREKAVSKEGLLITKHAQKPSSEEIRRNPRSRSARLRIMQKYVSTIPPSTSSHTGRVARVDDPAKRLRTCRVADSWRALCPHRQHGSRDGL